MILRRDEAFRAQQGLEEGEWMLEEERKRTEGQDDMGLQVDSDDYQLWHIKPRVSLAINALQFVGFGCFVSIKKSALKNDQMGWMDCRLSLMGHKSLSSDCAYLTLEPGAARGPALGPGQG
jgi:hypothetical protein